MYELLAAAPAKLILEAETYLVADDQHSKRLLERAIHSASGRRGDILQWRASDAHGLRLFSCYSQVSIGAEVYVQPRPRSAVPVVSVLDGEYLVASISDEWLNGFLVRARRHELNGYCHIESDGAPSPF